MSQVLEIGFRNRDVIRLSDCYITINKFLKHHKPIILYDIGANKGEWSYVMWKLNPNIKTIILFEPQNKYFSELEENNFLPNINKKVYNVALGDQNQVSEIKGGTASASILDTSEQDIFFPKSLSDDVEKISIKRLDDIFLSDTLPIPDTIKLDVQGYELFVLHGAKQTLKKTKYLIIELSFREFYANQPKLSEIILFLEKNNFMLIDFGYEWRDMKTKDLIQIDAFFSNNDYEE